MYNYSASLAPPERPVHFPETVGISDREFEMEKWRSRVKEVEKVISQTVPVPVLDTADFWPKRKLVLSR